MGFSSLYFHGNYYELRCLITLFHARLSVIVFSSQLYEFCYFMCGYRHYIFYHSFIQLDKSQLRIHQRTSSSVGHIDNLSKAALSFAGNFEKLAKAPSTFTPSPGNLAKAPISTARSQQSHGDTITFGNRSWQSHQSSTIFARNPANLSTCSFCKKSILCEVSREFSMTSRDEHYYNHELKIAFCEISPLYREKLSECCEPRKNSHLWSKYNQKTIQECQTRADSREKGTL